MIVVIHITRISKKLSSPNQLCNHIQEILGNRFGLMNRCTIFKEKKNL